MLQLNALTIVLDARCIPGQILCTGISNRKKTLRLSTYPASPKHQSRPKCAVVHAGLRSEGRQEETLRLEDVRLVEDI